MRRQFVGVPITQTQPPPLFWIPEISPLGKNSVGHRIIIHSFLDGIDCSLLIYRELSMDEDWTATSYFV